MPTRNRLLKLVAFAVGMAPLAALVVRAAMGGLGPNPIEKLLHQLGYFALVGLLVVLSLTPLQRFTGWTWPARIRRLVGLFAFAYATLHAATYVGLDRLFDFHTLGEDLAKRPFILSGFLAFACLLPLAATSSDRAVRRLGFVRWKRLHRLAYAAGALGVVHFFWRVKAATLEPALFAVAYGLLLLLRALPRRATRPS